MTHQRQALANIADEHGHRLNISGMALETLADLLGHDGCEHHLSPADAYGLTCAVRAIGAMVREAGLDLCEMAEMEVRK